VVRVRRQSGFGLDEVVTEVVRGGLAVVFDEVLVFQAMG
jgi:hypothetical protein